MPTTAALRPDPGIQRTRCVLALTAIQACLEVLRSAADCGTALKRHMNKIRRGVDVGTVANLMGHDNPNMLLTHCQHVLDKQKTAAVEALPDLGPCVRGHVPKLETPQIINKNKRH